MVNSRRERPVTFKDVNGSSKKSAHKVVRLQNDSVCTRVDTVVLAAKVMTDSERHVEERHQFKGYKPCPFGNLLLPSTPV